LIWGSTEVDDGPICSNHHLISFDRSIRIREGERERTHVREVSHFEGISNHGDSKHCMRRGYSMSVKVREKRRTKIGGGIERKEKREGGREKGN